MKEIKNCSKCERVMENCTREQVQKCLRDSECEYCDGHSYHYPYGGDESRHCRNCGAEWSVYK
jgi:hypothetical protein